jgi:hypothetical protein
VSGGTCVEVEYLDESFVSIRDSKNPEKTVPLPIGDYSALLEGLGNGNFDYERDYHNYNKSGITFQADRGWFRGRYCAGISMSHPTWEGESLWFSRPEWDSFKSGVQNGEFTLSKLREDKNKKVTA